LKEKGTTMSEFGLTPTLLLSPAKDPADYYFPVNVDQAKDLIGKLLTHIDAMNLPARAEKANKDLVRQSFWKWWAEVRDNALTSYRGCLAPIEVVRDPMSHTESAYQWLGGGDEEHIVSVTNGIEGPTGTVLEGIISNLPLSALDTISGLGAAVTNIVNNTKESGQD
jgi:hypothetical protein